MIGDAELELPPTAEALATRLLELRNERRRRQKEGKPTKKNLGPPERKAVLEKTGGRCHICGGVISSAWQADHVLARAGGGHGRTSNLLPAHALCNNYRWNYLPEEFQWVLKIGVWVRLKMEQPKSQLGRKILRTFFKQEVKRESRRRRKLPRDAVSNVPLQPTGSAGG